MDLNQKIKILRLSKNYTQNYMADELGIDPTNYSRLERGESKIPVERLKKIATILGTDINEFLASEIKNEQLDSNHSLLLHGILLEIRAIRKSLNSMETSPIKAEKSKQSNI
ncbi:MAG: XRE family transcriptional regulator [Crocinitomicaceae bacterium]|nr:XRE family transcriptional regulator [Crocinitomicaceae bacterium]